MPSRNVRRALGLRIASALVLGALLGACQLNVAVETNIDASGKGTLALRMGMDEELLTTARGDVAEMASFEALFSTLKKSGWAIVEEHPDGGLLRVATRTFKGSEGFDDGVGELRAALARNRSGLIGDLKFDLRLRADKGLFSTRSSFEGSIDTRSGVRLDPHLLSAVEDLVRFEVTTTLPGEASATGGQATSEGNTIVWRPSLGKRATFAARSEALRLGPLFVTLFVLLALLSAAIGSLVSRRRRAGVRLAPTPPTRDMVAPRALPRDAVVFDAKPIDVEALLGERVIRLEAERVRAD